MPVAAVKLPAPGISLGKLTTSTRYWLSPLAGYTNVAFRLAVRELGPLGLATTDLVNARALLRGSRKSLELIQTTPEDRPLAVQIYGGEPREMAEAARWLEAYGASVIDINMGCPVHKVVRGGGGSAMMCQPALAVRLVRGVVEAVSIPVTVKMRLGWSDDNWSAPYFAREFEQAGVAAIIIHGRTRAQGFSGSVNLAGIRAVVESVDHLPVIGNGDIRTAVDAAQMFEVSGCAGISIGRGALLNPWIFCQLWCADTGRPIPPQPTHRMRLEFMNRHFHLLVDYRGERFACLTFRKVANWYSRVLRPSRDQHDRLMRLDSVATFEGILEQLGNSSAEAGQDEQIGEVISVPRGPIEHW